MRMPSFLNKDFVKQTSGATVVEFALVLPLFLFSVMGMMDLGLQFYGQHILQGSVSQAARLSTLETFTGNHDALDDMVESRIRAVFKSADVRTLRRAYLSYEDIGQPEPWTDTNLNGQWDPGECFEDLNGSGSWESDSGRAGNGEADEVVLYEVSVSYDRIFPFWGLVKQSPKTELQAKGVLRNQPYAAGRTRPPACN